MFAQESNGGSRSTRTRGVWNVLAAATLLLVALGGCETTPKTTRSQVVDPDRLYSFWPQFPMDPHIQFLRSFKVSSDIEPEKSGLETLIYGDLKDTLPIQKPYGVAMWNGRIYVCDIKNNTGVVILDLKKQETRVMGVSGLDGMKQPTAIAISDDGMKYVADSVRGIIFVFDANERHAGTFALPDGSKPVSVAVFEDRLYVTDYATQTILALNRYTGEELNRIGGPGGEDGTFVRPLGVAVDPDGNVWVSDVIRCRIQKFSPEGDLLKAIGGISDTPGSFVRPKHLAIGSDGVVHIVDAAFSNVQLFNDQGHLLMYYGSAGNHPGAMNLPAGIAVNETDMGLFAEYFHPAFQPERLILVTNQFGRDKVAVYAMGSLREGYTAQDLVPNLAEIDSGITDNPEDNPLTGDILKKAGQANDDESDSEGDEDTEKP